MIAGLAAYSPTETALSGENINVEVSFVVVMEKYLYIQSRNVLSHCSFCILHPVDLICVHISIFCRKKFPSELSIMPATVHTLPSSAAAASTVACSEGRPHLPSHRSDHEIHTPEHRHRQLSHCPDVVGEILDNAVYACCIVTESFSFFTSVHPSLLAESY